MDSESWFCANVSRCRIQCPETIDQLKRNILEIDRFKLFIWRTYHSDLVEKPRVAGSTIAERTPALYWGTIVDFVRCSALVVLWPARAP